MTLVVSFKAFISATNNTLTIFLYELLILLNFHINAKHLNDET